MTAPDPLTNPARACFWAAQKLAMDAGPPWVELDAMPQEEVLCCHGNDSVTLTPDGWLVYVNRGKEVLYSRRLRATPEWIAELRGAPEAKRPSDPAPSEKPARGEGTPGSKAAKARGCTCPEQSGAMWTVDPECRLHGYGAVG